MTTNINRSLFFLNGYEEEIYLPMDVLANDLKNVSSLIPKENGFD